MAEEGATFTRPLVARITYTVLVETLNPAQSIKTSQSCVKAFDGVVGSRNIVASRHL